MEALLRWRHPEYGLLVPSGFIPVAEQTGLIVPIGRWVLGEACRRAREWQERYPGEAPLTIAVNLSARQLRYPELVGEVEDALRRVDLDPGASRWRQRKASWWRTENRTQGPSGVSRIWECGWP